MSRKLRNTINAIADELGIAHQTALLIYEETADMDEFKSKIEAFANGEGFFFLD